MCFWEQGQRKNDNQHRIVHISSEAKWLQRDPEKFLYNLIKEEKRKHRPHPSAPCSQPLKLKIYQHSQERKIWDPSWSQTESLLILKFLFVYFLVALGLRCGTWILIVSFGISYCGVQSLDVGVGSEVVVCGLSFSAACGISVPQSDRTWVPCIARQILNHWPTREAPDWSFILNEIVFCKQPKGIESS